jgi:undecaprenyl-diphosphatase
VVDELLRKLVVGCHRAIVAKGAATIRAVEFLAYVLLGIIQGLTEFLPVSSSGHLVLAGSWLGINPPGVVTEVALHMATLLSVVIVYRRDIAAIVRERRWRYIYWIALATVITVCLVLPLRDVLTQLADADYAVRLVGVLLIINAGWLLLTDLMLRRRSKPRMLNWTGVVFVGIGQALAALPGISRSGSTIGLGVLAGLKREDAARFSFLLSIPVILGAGILMARDLPVELTNGTVNLLGLSLAFITALVCGILAIHLVLRLLKQARFLYFAIWCAIVGVLAISLG